MRLPEVLQVLGVTEVVQVLVGDVVGRDVHQVADPVGDKRRIDDINNEKKTH